MMLVFSPALKHRPSHCNYLTPKAGENTNIISHKHSI